MTWCRLGARGGSTTRLGWACAAAVVCERSRQRTVLPPLLASWTLRVRRRVLSLSAPCVRWRSEARGRRLAPPLTLRRRCRTRVGSPRCGRLSRACVMSVCTAASVAAGVAAGLLRRSRCSCDRSRSGWSCSSTPASSSSRYILRQAGRGVGYPGIPMSNAWQLNCITWRTITRHYDVVLLFDMSSSSSSSTW